MHLSAAPAVSSEAAEIAHSESNFKPKTVRCAGMVLDLDHRRCFVADTDVGLSALEFAMVYILASRSGVPMSRDAISAALPIQVDSRMVDVYVSRSRAKLAAAGLEDAITTVWGRGYMAGHEMDDELNLAPAQPTNSCDADATSVPA